MIALLVGWVLIRTSMALQSPAFKDNAPLPQTFTGYGDFTSPPLSWGNAPKGTREFVLTLENMDAPMERFSTHWLLYGIPATVTGLPATPRGEKAGDHPAPIKQAHRGLNAMKWIGYLPPRPLESGLQHYTFTLYAVDVPVTLPDGATKEQLLAAIKGHVLAEARLTALVEHK